MDLTRVGGRSFIFETNREATPVISSGMNAKIKKAKIKKHSDCPGPPLLRDEAIRHIRARGHLRPWTQKVKANSQIPSSELGRDGGLQVRGGLWNDS